MTSPYVWLQGRVLYDLILYNNSKIADDVCFLVECDSSLKDDFIKAVKRYRIRKKVSIILTNFLLSDDDDKCNSLLLKLLRNIGYNVKFCSC